MDVIHRICDLRLRWRRVTAARRGCRLTAHPQCSGAAPRRSRAPRRRFARFARRASRYFSWCASSRAPCRPRRHAHRLIRAQTNNSTKSRRSYVARLAKAGIEARMEEIISSSFAAAEYLRQCSPASKEVYVVGEVRSPVLFRAPWLCTR